MKRLTSDNPSFDLNTIYGKDREAWVMGGGPAPDYEDCKLEDMIRRMAATFGVELLSENTDEFDEEMCDHLADGVETASGALAMLYHIAVQALEMRERLKKIEGILGCDYDLDRLRVLVDADSERRAEAKPAPCGYTCGQCAHFHLDVISRTSRCEVRRWAVDQSGNLIQAAITGSLVPYSPASEAKACDKFKMEIKRRNTGW